MSTDRIIFLGTAGARFVVARQVRASGGIWLSLDGTNVYIDPGPGALVRCRTHPEQPNPRDLDAIILSHRHLDHANDVNVMIEAMTDGGIKPKGTLFAPADALNDHDSIIDMYRNSLSENPAGPSAPEDQLSLAQTYLNREDRTIAAEKFALVLERYPASVLTRRVRSEQADLLSTELEYDWAPIDSFQSALELSRAGRFNRASSTFDEIILARPNSGISLAALIQKEIIEYRRTGDATPLLETFSTAQAAYPYGLGGLPANRWNYFLGQIGNAQQAIQSNPDDSGSYIRMSQAYLQTAAYQPGIDVLNKAIALAPDSPNACNLLGYCYLGAQQYDEAVSAFQMLIDIDPDNPNSYDSMAEGCYAKGDTTVAIEFYRKSIATDSSFTNPYFMLGPINQNLGRTGQAISYLEMYLKLDPDGFQAQNARAILTRLKTESEANEE